MSIACYNKASIETFLLKTDAWKFGFEMRDGNYVYNPPVLK
jgi:hypothetical protein